ncbi:heparinase II/III family protein [Rhizorhabdus dicambivorans]|uniref:Heparinase n=1 Tax=Rhizorhabdus dicambivorans TaxID=1850238 RepID=A0A2A4FQN1_9SPHN|nr:heparinase II/III family protein [Rhizorhabdus dicambivorans]ATE63785.1 heparinase [Rhizorhabdus dicambivorans]PCE40429.1 heparinase [Rhizorhabdus dicambivorans]
MNDAGGSGFDDRVEPGRRLISVEHDRSHSLAERLAGRVHALSWRTPVHHFRLRGRYPLKLFDVPADPIEGLVRLGGAMLDGEILWQGESVRIEDYDFRPRTMSTAFSDHLQSFAWLRDLSAAGPRQRVAPIAELLAKRWLDAFGKQIHEFAWRPDLWGRRILFWGCHAPLIMSSDELRTPLLNTLSRGARHLDNSADKAAPGLARVAAWTGVVAAGLLIPGGELRQLHGEKGLERALADALHSDGGIVSRSPVEQMDLIGLLAMLRKYYEMRGQRPPVPLGEALAMAVPPLLGLTLGDGGLSSWQGAAPIDGGRIDAVVTASGVRARPLRQSREWGYQRLSVGHTRIIADAAPPPISRFAHDACASTLGFEMSDGPWRLIVNCGGGRGANNALHPDLAQALRSTAAHSTLVLADSHSTAVHPDGTLGKGVTEVEVERQEDMHGSQIDMRHDGYARRYGFAHRRRIEIAAGGREVHGQDQLLPTGRGPRGEESGFAIRFHLAPGVDVSATADGGGALLRIAEGALWRFRATGGEVGVEDSLWIDSRGRPQPTRQLVISGTALSDGIDVKWAFARSG